MDEQLQSQSHTQTALLIATPTTSDDRNSQPQSSPPSKTSSRPKKLRKLTAVDHKSPQTVSENPKSAITKPSKTKTITNRTQSIIVRPLSHHGEIELAIRHLRNVDPHLAALINIHQCPTFDSFHPPFLALTKSILYQQLAYKTGTSIYTRFVSLCGGESSVLPESVLSLTPQQLRQIGVSGRKANYLHDLSRKYINGILSDSSIVDMDDKSLFTMLTMVNGIGSWSVHMFMIFSLHRPDVLPINDLGIRKGVQLLYGIDELPRPSQMEQLCEKWKPYRSVASCYLWRFVEAKKPSSNNGAVSTSQVVSLQLQQQILDPINDILNLGTCAWGQ